MASQVDWNGVRFRVEDPAGHVESYFLKANAPDGSRALWIKATILASPGRGPYAVTDGWAIYFERGKPPIAVKNSARWSASHFSPRGLRVRVGELVWIREDWSKGDIERAGHRIQWKLDWTGDREPLVMLPYPWMYSGPVPATKLVTPMPDLTMTGELTVDGRKIQVEGWKGMLGHNWGKRHGVPYSWGHCNCWKDEDSLVVEAATGQLSVGPVSMPPRTIVAVRYHGETYYMNSVVSMMRNRGEVLPRRWLVKAFSNKASVELDFAAQSDSLAGLYYPNPDGAMTYVANSKLAFAQIRLQLPDGSTVETSTECAAWEFARSRPPEGVAMLV